MLRSEEVLVPQPHFCVSQRTLSWLCLWLASSKSGSSPRKSVGCRWAKAAGLVTLPGGMEGSVPDILLLLFFFLFASGKSAYWIFLYWFKLPSEFLILLRELISKFGVGLSPIFPNLFFICTMQWLGLIFFWAEHTIFRNIHYSGLSPAPCYLAFPGY